MPVVEGFTGVELTSPLVEEPTLLAGRQRLSVLLIELLDSISDSREGL